MITYITGATSGFGYAVALRAAQLGHHIIITGRRKERLVEIQDEIQERYKVSVYPLCFDIRNNDACVAAWNRLPEEWKQIDILVNNAGLAAGYATIDEACLSDFEQMIDTNVKGLLYISKLIMPVMKSRKCGHIINISSIAGVEVYPNGNVYCATKHAVNALTKAMRIDLLPYNIRVGTISPGAAETEFSLVRFKGDQEKSDAVYKGLFPLGAEDIADAFEYMVTRPNHVNINDILLTPTRQGNTYVIYRDPS